MYIKYVTFRFLQMYFYDTQACKSQDLSSSNSAANKKKKEEPNYFAGLKKSDTAQDVRRTEFFNIT